MTTASQDARPSRTPAGRSAAFERGVVVVIGLLAVLAGAAAVVVSTGLLGTNRARRPVLDPLALQWWRENPQIAYPIAIVGGLLLLCLGLWWLLRAMRPEQRPDVRLEQSSGGRLTVTSNALTEAVRADAEEVTGVTRARARMAGSDQAPSLRLTLSLQEGTNVRDVWDELDEKVLARARGALGTDTLPTSIRLRLDRAPRQRVR